MVGDKGSKKPKSRFWSFMDDRMGQIGFTVKYRKEQEAEGLLLIDQGATLSLGQRFLLPLRWSNQPGTIAITPKRLVVSSDTLRYIDLQFVAQGVLDVELGMTKTGDLRLRLPAELIGFRTWFARQVILTIRSKKAREAYQMLTHAQLHGHPTDPDFVRNSDTSLREMTRDSS